MKIKIRLLALIIIFSTIAMSAQAAVKSLDKVQTEMRVTQIMNRAEQIKAMDLQHLNRIERKELRTELRSMNKELRQFGPTYVYISAGALILIIILLLILI